MNETPSLDESLRRLTSLLPRNAGPLTEERVRAAFRSQRRTSLRRRTFFAVAAACLALAFTGLLLHHSHGSAPAVVNRAEGGSFIALPYSQSDVPVEQGVIVRVKLQAQDWSALGLPAPARGTAMNADLLIGQDGVPRAVRLLDTQ
jgi:hypothetical protein